MNIKKALTIVLLSGLSLSTIGQSAAASWPQDQLAESSAYQQNSPNDDRRQNRGPDFQAIAKLLKLDQTQLSTLKSIMKTHHQAMESLRQQRSERDEAQRKQLDEDFKAQLQSLLNSEQMEKLKDYLDAHKPPMRRGERGEGRRLERRQ